MNVFFDNCTAPVLAATLDAFLAHEGHRAFHIKDVPDLADGRHASDVAWIERLRRDTIRWIFITGDARVLKNAAERAALRSAGLHGFVLAPAYQKTALNQQAATILWQWPQIQQVTKLLAPPAMHEIPIRRLTQLRQLPL